MGFGHFNTGFRPLIGVNFCKLNILTIYHIFSNYRVRPLIGVNFCKQSGILIIAMLILGFRPLIGVNFCKPEERLKFLRGYQELFPSPYRG